METIFGAVADPHAAQLSMSELHDLLRRPVRRRAFLGGAAAAALSGLLLSPSYAGSAAALGARRLSFGADPTREMNVAFSIATAFRSASVEYGIDDKFGSTASVQDEGIPGSSMRYGQASISGLKADTTYKYRIRVDGQMSSIGNFRTAPRGPASFRFTAFGDQGVTTEAAAAVGAVRRENSAFHIVTGDLCYADSTGMGLATDIIQPQIWDDWLSMVEPAAASIPWMCAAGNHEMEPGLGPHGYGGMLGRLALPDNGAPKCPTSYSFRYGNVGFIALDSNDVSFEIPANLGYSGNAQRTWLAATLADMRRAGSGVDFVVVICHHSPYASGSAHGSEGGVRDVWVPLFDKYAVDLVLSGHNHCYERTLPLRGGQVVSTDPASVNSGDGTTYVTVGGGGRPLNEGFGATTGRSRVSYAPRRNEVEKIDWSIPSRRASYSFASVDVMPALHPGAATTLTIRILSTADESEIDRVVLRRTATAAAVGTHGSSRSSSMTEVAWIAGGTLGVAAAAGSAGYYLNSRHRQEEGW